MLGQKVLQLFERLQDDNKNKKKKVICKLCLSVLYFIAMEWCSTACDIYTYGYICAHNNDDKIFIYNIIYANTASDGGISVDQIVNRLSLLTHS